MGISSHTRGLLAADDMGCWLPMWGLLAADDGGTCFVLVLILLLFSNINDKAIPNLTIHKCLSTIVVIFAYICLMSFYSCMLYADAHHATMYCNIVGRMQNVTSIHRYETKMRPNLCIFLMVYVNIVGFW
jgi:hypothetical protein